MHHSPSILGYFGSEPSSESFPHRLARFLGNVLIFIIFAIVITIRFALLLAGFTLIALGTLFLTIAGRRSAGQTISRWYKRFKELCRLWLADILRPLRRQHPPLAVLPP